MRSELLSPSEDVGPARRDPLTVERRIKAGANHPGAIMPTTFISLVLGSDGSGVSPLLEAFAARADVMNTMSIDGHLAITLDRAIS
jgi:hypothetical protein